MGNLELIKKKNLNNNKINCDMLDDIISNNTESCEIEESNIDIETINNLKLLTNDNMEDDCINDKNIEDDHIINKTIDDSLCDDNFIKKNKFVGRNARIIKRCKEINRTCDFDIGMYGINNDNTSVDDDEDEDKTINIKENINICELIEETPLIE